MVLTRLPLLAGPTEGERFKWHEERQKSGRDIREYQRGCLNNSRTTRHTEGGTTEGTIGTRRRYTERCTQVKEWERVGESEESKKKCTEESGHSATKLH